MPDPRREPTDPAAARDQARTEESVSTPAPPVADDTEIVEEETVNFGAEIPRSTSTRFKQYAIGVDQRFKYLLDEALNEYRDARGVRRIDPAAVPKTEK